MNDYEALIAFGHSPAKAAEILLDVKRGDEFSMRWLKYIRDLMGDRSTAAEEIKRLREALEPFACIWGINRALQPLDDRPLMEYVAGTWPTMGDARRAYEVLGK